MVNLEGERIMERKNLRIMVALEILGIFTSKVLHHKSEQAHIIEQLYLIII